MIIEIACLYFFSKNDQVGCSFTIPVIIGLRASIKASCFCGIYPQVFSQFHPMSYVYTFLYINKSPEVYIPQQKISYNIS